MISDEIHWYPPQSITIERSLRQRQTPLNLDIPFIESIKRGIINPLIVREGSLVLVAGERRLEAAKLSHLPLVPTRHFETLDPMELLEIELDENLKRLDLPWQDQCRTISRMHEVYTNTRPGWTQESTAARIGYSPAQISQALRVSRDLSDPRIEKSNSINAAYAILARRDSRHVEDALDSIVEAGAGVVLTTAIPAPGYPLSSPVFSPLEVNKPALPPPLPFLLADFTDWASTYSGPKFNFLHCDFPYGVQAFKGGSNRQHSVVGYVDDPEIYWKLLATLCSNLDKILQPSAHMMFWFSMNHYNRTLEYFRTHAPSLVIDPFPLIWFKSCNTGMIPDSNRGPRRVYETAFMASREDRKILRPVANLYAAPTSQSRTHPSEKPVSVLKHFFQMFVDGTSKVLDPTCGSGSALEAAECLGAKQVLGLELDPEHHASACRNLKNSRLKRTL